MEHKELIGKLKWCLGYFNSMGLSEPNITIQEAIQALESKEPKVGRTIDDILKEMVDIMPFAISDRTLPYIKEAMRIYASQSVPTPSDAVEFVEWIKNENYKQNSMGFWKIPYAYDLFSTSELYQQFLTTKQK